MQDRIKTRIQNKHDLEVNWLKASFVPLQGELIVYDIEVDAEENILTKDVDGQTVQLLPAGRTEPYVYERFKIGDGITPINNLPFILDPYYTKDETATMINSLISTGTADPSVETATRFYFKYSIE